MKIFSFLVVPDIRKIIEPVNKDGKGLPFKCVSARALLNDELELNFNNCCFPLNKIGC